MVSFLTKKEKKLYKKVRALGYDRNQSVKIVLMPKRKKKR